MADDTTPKEADAAEATADDESTDSEPAQADASDAQADDAQADDAEAERAEAADAEADENADDAEAEEAVADEADDDAAEADASEDEDDDAEDEEDAADDVSDEEDEDEDEDDEDEDDDQTGEGHVVSVEQLLKAGSHFGHLTSRWNPRMDKYIFMERNNIHIIDLMQTQVLLDRAAKAARRFASRGKKILFTGTKKQAKDIVRDYAEEADMPFMVDRWLGGTMTNFQTIRKSIRRMEDIERMEKDGTLDKLKKKEKLMRLREHEKLENTLGGIRNMSDLPGAIYVVDVKREEIAVSEARKLGIPIIAMVDTNGDPGEVDYPIPANDDALSSIDLITGTITDAVLEGAREHQMKREASRKKQSS